MYLSWQEGSPSAAMPLAWQEQGGVCTSVEAVGRRRRDVGCYTDPVMGVALLKVQTHPMRTAAIRRE